MTEEEKMSRILFCEVCHQPLYKMSEGKVLLNDREAKEVEDLKKQPNPPPRRCVFCSDKQPWLGGSHSR
ncbi:MAG: hypothetical protein K2N70_03445 [Helicobacter sp.]|nr:hypothetical protein [Helicobacter sp.]